MLVVSISVPREIDAQALLPKRAHPFGGTPNFAPAEYRADCIDREEADLLVNSMRAQPGVRAHIVEDPV